MGCDEMPKTGAVAVMKAGEKARRAQQRVADAERVLAKAQKAQARADAAYMALLRQTLGDRPWEPTKAATEVTEQPTA